nr:MAG TPA: adhesin [Caudoviricetes sp.]
MVFLAGCSTTPVQEPSTPKAPESLSQNFDCKGKEYYTNLT